MSESELTPEEEQVRRLLAEARHDEPIPTDVADRLDRVLADLTPPTAPRQLAPVVDLAARRRRRNAAVLLAGAAAVIVGGFAFGQVVETGSDDTGSDAGGSAVADRDTSESGGSGGDFNSEKAEPPAAAPSAPADSQQARLPLFLSSTNLEGDVRLELRRLRSSSTAAAEDAPNASAANPTCATAAPSAYGTGEFYAALFDGVPAVLAVRPAEGARQRADVLDCSTAAELGSVEVPAP